MGDNQVAKESKFLEALKVIETALEAQLGKAETETVIDNFLGAALDGLVDGVEVVSSALPGGAAIVAGEKMVLPWAEAKAKGALTGLVHNFLAKYQAKQLANIPAPTNAVSAEQGTSELNKL